MRLSIWWCQIQRGSVAKRRCASIPVRTRNVWIVVIDLRCTKIAPFENLTALNFYRPLIKVRPLRNQTHEAHCRNSETRSKDSMTFSNRGIMISRSIDVMTPTLSPDRNDIFTLWYHCQSSETIYFNKYNNPKAATRSMSIVEIIGPMDRKSRVDITRLSSWIRIQSMLACEASV